MVWMIEPITLPAYPGYKSVLGRQSSKKCLWRSSGNYKHKIIIPSTRVEMSKLIKLIFLETTVNFSAKHLGQVTGGATGAIAYLIDGATTQRLLKCSVV